jgi:DNA-nicking Smr family endonuclease
MKKKPDKTISQEDRDLFRQAVAGTRPLKHDKVEDYRPPRSPHPVKRDTGAGESFQDMLSDEMDLEAVSAADELLFQRPGLQSTVMRKLRRGQFPCEAELDLHGLRIDDARSTVARFLDQAVQHGQRCIRIVHGKGYGSSDAQPVLKNKINTWLRQRPEVLAFCSARPADGGTGAVYILLKRG